MKSQTLIPVLCLFSWFSQAARGAETPVPRKILFFSKSSGFEHSVISYKGGQPSFAEKVLSELGGQNRWEFTFSKDGSLFSDSYLAGFDAVMFYTTGDLTTPGTDGQPAMSLEGKRALLEYVHKGGGFVGTHSASDTFHTGNESKKGPERYLNFREKADPYVRMLGAEFIKHGPQQSAKMRNVDPTFPGLSGIGEGFEMMEEWYSLKDFSEDMHVLLVQESGEMKGIEYQRPPYPATWARMHGKGRVFYTSMGHREDVWTSRTFQEILAGGLRWALGDAKAEVPSNLMKATPDALQNPPYPEAKAK
jgi:type 1 glutamine amidotransferase